MRFKGIAVGRRVPKLEKLSAQMLADGRMRRGVTYDVQIYHDDWCKLLTDGGDCNCDPDFDFVEIPDVQAN